MCPARVVAAIFSVSSLHGETYFFLWANVCKALDTACQPCPAPESFPFQLLCAISLIMFAEPSRTARVYFAPNNQLFELRNLDEC